MEGEEEDTRELTVMEAMTKARVMEATIEGSEDKIMTEMEVSIEEEEDMRNSLRKTVDMEDSPPEMMVIIRVEWAEDLMIEIEIHTMIEVEVHMRTRIEPIMVATGTELERGKISLRDFKDEVLQLRNNHHLHHHLLGHLHLHLLHQVPSPLLRLQQVLSPLHHHHLDPSLPLLLPSLLHLHPYLELLL